LPEQRGLTQQANYSRRGRASEIQNEGPPDIFAEAVAKALQQEREPQFVEVPAALRDNQSLGFAAKAAAAVGGAALVALVYVFYFSASDDSTLASLPTWQSLKSSLFPAGEPKTAPTLVVQDSDGPVNEPLLLGVTVNAPGPGASVTIDRMPAGSRLTSGKRMSASEWRVPAELIPDTSVIPPADFAGEMNLSATLRNSDGAALVSSFVRLTWGNTAPPQDAVAASTDAPIEPSVVLAVAPQRQQSMTPQAVAPQATTQQAMAPQAVAPQPPQAMAPSVAPIQTISSSTQAGEEPALDLPPNEIAYFVRRAQELMASGDFQAARLLLIRAARAHHARAALLLAKSYDPSGSPQSSAGDSGPDLNQARNWYQKARDWGSPDAQRQLDALANYR
jgi:hypothetical protein